MSTIETPPGLTAKGDGTFYGEYRNVPVGWLFAKYTDSPADVKEAHVEGWGDLPASAAYPHTVVQCWPPKPKWVAEGGWVVLDGKPRASCYRHGGSGSASDPELAERVARLLNGDDQ